MCEQFGQSAESIIQRRPSGEDGDDLSSDSEEDGVPDDTGDGGDGDGEGEGDGDGDGGDGGDGDGGNGDGGNGDGDDGGGSDGGGGGSDTDSISSHSKSKTRRKRKRNYFLYMIIWLFEGMRKYYILPFKLANVLCYDVAVKLGVMRSKRLIQERYQQKGLGPFVALQVHLNKWGEDVFDKESVFFSIVSICIL